MKKLYPFFLLLFFSLPAFAQVTTDPAFPTIDGPVTLTIDLKQAEDGRAAPLLELSQKGEIFLWSGAGDDADAFKFPPPEQTNFNSPMAEKFELTPLGDDVWQITLTPKTFYNIPDGANITQLGVLLKNGDGSAQTEDFYIPIYESGFNLNINTPDLNNGDAYTLQNNNFPLSATTNEAADFSLYVNEELFSQQTAASNFELSLPTVEAGIYAVRLVAATATESKEISFTYQVFPQPQVADLPAGLEQGVNIHSETSATFVLLAPQKDFVLLMGDFNNFEPKATYIMNKTADGELFWLTINNLEPDTEYAYYYLVDGETDIADPYSETVLDAANDDEISNSRYPGLRSFPADANTDRLTVFSTNDAYNWQVENFNPPAKEDLVIYELLVRDFSSEQSFQGVINRLDYLDSLNITAIELLPIMEFNGNKSWGYNPTFQTAVDKWYGPKEKLKELIDKAHQRGMAVILDIALNHQDYPAPFLKMWWQGSTASPENPFFNVTPKHPYNVFTDLNHESAYTQDFVDQVTRFWLEEYKVDGFRFDLSKGFTQKETGDNVAAWGAYDASRIALLKRMADEVWSVDEDAFIILEHFADNKEETELANYGLMLWGNLGNNYGEALMGWQLDNAGSSFDWLSYKERSWNNPNVVGYIESHDEERLLFKAQEYGNAAGDYSVKELETALERAELAAAFFLPVPGPKMLWQFQELGYDISIEQNGRTGEKPVKWEYLDAPARQELYRTISELNYLKTTYPVFGTEDFEMPETGQIRTLKLNGDTMNVVVVGNFGLEAKEASLSFQHSGWWYSYFEKDSLETSGSASFTLEPGEFRLFTDQSIFYRGEIESPTAVVDNRLSESIALYPNPSNGQIQLVLPAGVSGSVKLRLIDAGGRTVWNKQLVTANKPNHSINFKHLKAGFYAIEIVYGNKKGVKRILLQ